MEKRAPPVRPAGTGGKLSTLGCGDAGGGDAGDCTGVGEGLGSGLGEGDGEGFGSGLGDGDGDVATKPVTFMPGLENVFWLA